MLRRFTTAAAQIPPHFVSVDGLMVTEAKATLKCLDSCLTTKWCQPYSSTCIYVYGMFSITMVLHCIWGYGVPAIQIRVQQLQLEDGAGLNLYKWIYDMSPTFYMGKATKIPNKKNQQKKWPPPRHIFNPIDQTPNKAQPLSNESMGVNHMVISPLTS